MAPWLCLFRNRIISKQIYQKKRRDFLSDEMISIFSPYKNKIRNISMIHWLLCFPIIYVWIDPLKRSANSMEIWIFFFGAARIKEIDCRRFIFENMYWYFVTCHYFRKLTFTFNILSINLMRFLFIVFID